MNIEIAKRELEFLEKARKEQENAEKMFFSGVAAAFMEKWGTDNIFFDYENSNAPSCDYYGEGDTFDCQIIALKFVKNEGETDNNLKPLSVGDIKSISAHLYYDGYDVIDTPYRFSKLDYLDLSNYVIAQLEERFIPNED